MSSGMYPKVVDPVEEQFGGNQQQQAPKSWWLVTWSYKFSSVLAVGLFICGLITAISVTTGLILGGILQMIIALVILAFEAPSFVPFLAIIQPAGAFLDRKPHWVKATLYLIFTIFPFFLPGILGIYSFGVFFLLGFLLNLAIFAIYVRLVLGVKANRDQMRAGAGGGSGVFP